MLKGHNLVEIVHEIRLQMKDETMCTMVQAFRRNDQGQGLNKDEFGAVLGKAGVHLSLQSLRHLENHFGSADAPMEKKKMNWRRFLEALRGEMSPRRLAVITKAWDKIARGGASVSMQTVFAHFNPRGHPLVAMGRARPDEVVRSMENQLYLSTSNTQPDTITWAQFLGLYIDQSAAQPYDDDAFVARVCGCFQIQETSNRSVVPPAEVARILGVLEEKIRQKRKAASLFTPWHTLKLQMHVFGPQSDNHWLDKTQFYQSMEIWGLWAQQSNVLWQWLSTTDNACLINGKVDVDQFTRLVCSDPRSDEPRREQTQRLPVATQHQQSVQQHQHHSLQSQRFPATQQVAPQPRATQQLPQQLPQQLRATQQQQMQRMPATQQRLAQTQQGYAQEQMF